MDSQECSLAIVVHLSNGWNNLIWQCFLTLRCINIGTSKLFAQRDRMLVGINMRWTSSLSRESWNTSSSLATLLQAQIYLLCLLGCAVASVLEQSDLELWPGTLCCVLGLDTLLSQCLSPPASHPEESRNTPGCFMLLKPG